MAKTIYSNMEEAEEMEGQLGGFAWWPLFGVLGIPGGLLSWEVLSPLPQIPVQAVSFALTRQFMRLVEQHYLDTTSVADYAAMLHVTTNHLIKTVRVCLGQPAGQIIRERLLVEAKRLLRYSDLPVAEIAARLNFEDPSYFSRYFKEKTGSTPSEFRTLTQLDEKWEPGHDLGRPLVLRRPDLIQKTPALTQAVFVA